MLRSLTQTFCILACSSLFAAMGGPDTFGYIWKDSNEPDGPVFNWIDITTTGTLINGLGDDNVVGPYVMETDFQYYWYGRKFMWIGSNGYVAFQNANMASPFPLIPEAGSINDYVTGLGSDLNFLGAGNPGQCYLYDDADVTIVAWVGVPFWNPVAPTWTGSNTFEIILSKADSSVTIQYLEVNGLTQNNDIIVGIESVAGSIGLMHSADVYPVANYAVKFYMPVESDLEVRDATVNWNTDASSGGIFRSRNGAPVSLTTNVKNIGNMNIGGFDVEGELLNAGGGVLVSDQTTLDTIHPGLDTTFTFVPTFDPLITGTYTFRSTLSGVVDELVTDNNQKDQEIVVVDTTTLTQDLHYHGAIDDGIGLSWNGGNGGVAVYIKPPYYPAYATHTTVRILANTGLAGYTMRVYDDDGPGGLHGTLLDSVMIPGDLATLGDQVIPLTVPLTILDGGVYVEWYMMGANISIAQDINPPFSLRTYEIVDGVWAEYRDRESIDFFLGLRLTQSPIFDVGCTGFFAPTDGQEIGSPTSVRVWVSNFGNQIASGFPINYRFGNGAVVTQNVPGPINPGQQTLVTFTQQLTPIADASDQLCAWSSWDLDDDVINDTTCINLVTWTGIEEGSRLQATIAPNPANEQVWITELQAGKYELQLFDLTGRTVLNGQHTVSTSALGIDVGSLPAGTYRLHLHNADGSFIAPLVVEH